MNQPIWFNNICERADLPIPLTHTHNTSDGNDRNKANEKRLFNDTFIGKNVKCLHGSCYQLQKPIIGFQFIPPDIFLLLLVIFFSPFVICFEWMFTRSTSLLWLFSFLCKIWHTHTQKTKSDTEWTEGKLKLRKTHWACHRPELSDTFFHHKTYRRYFGAFVSCLIPNNAPKKNLSQYFCIL